MEALRNRAVWKVLLVLAVVTASIAAGAGRPRVVERWAVVTAAASTPVRPPFAVDDPLRANGVLVVDGGRGASRVLVELEVDRRATVASEPVEGELALVRHARDCAPTTGSFVRCRVAVQARGGVARLVVSPGGAGVLVASSEARLLRRTRAVNVGGDRASAALLLVLLATPLVWALHRRVASSQWLLAGLGAGVLALVSPVFAGVLVAYLLLAWQLGRLSRRRAALRAPVLWLGITGSLGFLLVWKYGLAGIGAVFATIDLGAGALPLGVSYFVIRLVDTQLRWYRGELGDATLREYLAFALFPATIPAGPIETLDHFRACRVARLSGADLAAGLSRATLGLFKKVVVADLLLAQLLFHRGGGLLVPVAEAPEQAGASAVWSLLALSFAYAYADFSAYSDIAIGVGRLHGYRVRENFEWPVLATSLRDFWARWHMSLSQWSMRNLYFPLMLATRTALLPLLVTMLTIGLWHEYDWPWFLWAVHHTGGLAVAGVLARHARRVAAPPRLRAVAGWAATMAFVAAGHAFVLFDDVGVALQVYARAWTSLAPW